MNSMDDVNVGDVVYCAFPMEEGGELPHYCLVIAVNTDQAGTRIRVAYGSSKQVSASGHRDWEVVATKADEINACGLRKPTRFDLKKTAWKSLQACSIEGVLPKTLYGQFKRAAIAARLI